MRTKKLLIGLALLSSVLVYSCKEKPPPPKTDEEIKIELLSKSWVPASTANAITIDGIDVSADWTSFVLTFGDKSYQSSGAAFTEVWPTGPGTWSFGSDVNTIIRDDNIEIDINVTDNSLFMQFNYTKPGGRVSGTEGNWKFNMVPQ